MKDYVCEGQKSVAVLQIVRQCVKSNIFCNNKKEIVNNEEEISISYARENILVSLYHERQLQCMQQKK